MSSATGSHPIPPAAAPPARHGAVPPPALLATVPPPARHDMAPAPADPSAGPDRTAGDRPGADPVDAASAGPARGHDERAATFCAGQAVRLTAFRHLPLVRDLLA